jgi:protein-tyrosine phosphatase
MRAGNAIDRNFGTVRGLVRLGLSYGQVLAVPAADLARVQRLVFVCQGNICRSAFADVLARDLKMSAASFGLSTTSGLSAHPPVIDAARELSVELSGHRTTTVADFDSRPGDLLLAMEVRQVTKLRRDPRFAELQIDLLGRYAGLPHVHDPYQLNDDYVRICLIRIDRAVRGLVKSVAAARAL